MAAVHMRLADALEACEEPENEDVVTAVLAGLLAPPRLSSKAASRGYENLLAEHDFAEIEALRILTEDHLVKLGVGMGHAAQVMAAIRPPIKEAALPDLVPADEDSTQPQRKRSGKVAAPGSFCKLDATGYPVHSEWSVFRPKFLSYLGAAQLFEEDELEIIRAALLQPESGIGAGWKDGGPADRLLWNEFVNVGAEGIPQTLQELLPQDAGGQGVGTHLGAGSGQERGCCLRSVSGGPDEVRLRSSGHKVVQEIPVWPKVWLTGEAK